MECQVPRGVPGVLPGIGHRDDVIGVEMQPFVVSPELVRIWRWWSGRVAIQPHIHVIVVELLAPQKSSKCLPLHRACALREIFRAARHIKTIGFRFPCLEDFFGICEGLIVLHSGQA